MKYNTSTNTIYEVFGKENKKYVDLALAALSQESRSIAILKKKYGDKYDGVGGVRFLSYSENEFLISALRRVDSYARGIKVLVEVYKEKDEQILDRFRKKSDVQILSMLRALSEVAKPKVVSLLPNKSSVLAHFGVSEDILEAAMDHVMNNDHKRMYLYYYGIARSKMPMEVILKLFPNYTQNKIKEVLLDIQNKLPEYIKIEQEKTKINEGEDAPNKRTYNKSFIDRTTSYGSGFRYTSYFDYFFDKDDTIAQKREKREIVIDFLNMLDDNKRQVIKKIFGDDYNHVVPNINLSKDERNIFNDVRVRTRRYIQRILDVRYKNTGKIYVDDRVILTKDNGFKEKINMYFENKKHPLAMEIFAHYVSNHEEVKEYLSLFYDLDTLELIPNVYSSRNDNKKLREIVSEIKDYINVCSSISKAYKKQFINYFKKSYMSEERVNLVYEMVLNAIDTLSDEEKKLLQLLYGEDYKELNIYANISSSDVDVINQAIDKISAYVAHSLEMLNTYKASIFVYFHKAGMSVDYKERLDAEITRFINESSSKGKYVAVMLYGKDYNKLQTSVNLSDEQIKLLNSLLDEIGKHINSNANNLKKRKPSRYTKSTSFFDFFIDQNGSEEENRLIKEEIKKAMDNSNYKESFFKFYDNDYNLRSDIELAKQDKLTIRYYRGQIFIKVFGATLPKSISDMAINGRTNGDRRIKIIKETYKYVNSVDSSTKRILMKVYGEDFHSFNSEVELTNYELLIINKFNLDLNAYIKKVVPFVKERQKIKKAKNILPKDFFSFLSEINTDIPLEELTRDARAFVNNSKSKHIASVKKLYGEEIKELNESVEPTEDDIIAVRSLIRDIRARYRRGKTAPKRTYNKKETYTLTLPKDILDNFDINYNESDRDKVINRIKFNINIHESAFSLILKDVYGDNLNEYKCPELQIPSKDKVLIKASIKVINNLFAKDISDFVLKDDLLEYLNVDILNREESIEKLRDKLNTMKGPDIDRFKKYFNFMYDDNLKLVRPMILNTSEAATFDKVIKRLTKKPKEPKVVEKKAIRKRVTINTNNFYDNFLFSGEEKVPEDRKKTILKIVRGSRAIAANLSLQLFGPNLDKECNDIELLNANKTVISVFIKAINKRLTNTYGRGLFMLADNFFEQFYLETDTDGLKEVLRNYIINYLDASHSKCMSDFRDVYDKNYNLKESYEFKGNKRNYNSFIRSIKTNVDKYRTKIIGGTIPKVEEPKVEEIKEEIIEVKKQTPIKLDMMDLGDNGYLALTNDLFDIRLTGTEELDIVDEELTDDIIMSAYNELNDSNTIIDLLMISEETLVNFYLSHIDDLDDPKEAFNYLIHLGKKDVIKRLMVSPLFLRVVNYLSDEERKIIYLKLVQVSNSSLTDEYIAKIAEVDINSVREYEIMTKEDKINYLNEYIIKRK